MKNLVVICLLLSAFIFAQDCEVKSYLSLRLTYPAAEIRLPSEFTLNLSKMPDVLPKIKNFSTNDTAYWAYQAMSDSSVLVFVLTGAVKFFKICSSEEECHVFDGTFFIRDFIIEEFNRFQAAGVFSGSSEESDSLIHHIIERFEVGDVSGKTNYSGRTYSPDYDMAASANTSAISCRVPIQYEGDLCAVIDTVRQCKIHLQSPMSLGNPLRQNNALEFRNQVFRNRDASGKFLNKSTARKVKY